jgi:hypothetical protein
VKLSRMAIAGYVGLVFASGAVLGVFGDRLYNVSTVSGKIGGGKTGIKLSPEEFRKKRLEALKSSLSLSDEQVTRIGLVYDETRALYEEENKRSFPILRSIDKNQIDKISAILTPKQREEYDQLLQQRREDRKKKGGRPGGPGPGPGF